MSGVLALITRDLLMARRTGGGLLTLVLFFLSIGVLVPFAIGPDKQLLAQIAPGVIWIALLLSALLGLDRILGPDHQDGTLQALRHASLSLPAIMFAKLVSYWILTAAPLVLMSPLMGLMLSLPAGAIPRTLFSLIAGTPAIAAFGLIAAALTVSLKHGSLIAPVLVLPFLMPVLIFGISSLSGDSIPGQSGAAMLFLLALSLLAAAFAPFVAALALRLGDE